MPRHNMSIKWENMLEEVGWEGDLYSLRMFVLLVMLHQPNDSERDVCISHYFMDEKPKNPSYYNHLVEAREKIKTVYSILMDYQWLKLFIANSGYKTEGEVLEEMGYDLEDVYAGNP